MRFVAVALVLTALGCASEPQVTPTTRAHYTRPLVTDQLPFMYERANVRARELANDWCLRRYWPHSDEFVVCNPRPYINQSTPPMVTIVRYDATDRAQAYAVFTPVPCRMYGKCDVSMDTQNVWELDFVDHSAGLRGGLIFIGENAKHNDDALWSMQQRTVDALTVELANRFGRPVWSDPHQYGAVWQTATSDIGLFVMATGEWVVETHELRRTGPPGLAAL